MAAARRMLFGMALLALAGCACFRTNPLERNRGAVVLVFDTRTSGDLKALRRTLARYDARATVFVSGQIQARRAAELQDLCSEGHEIGLAGLKGVDARSYSRMYGPEKYFQDEILAQVLGAQRYGLDARYYLLPQFYEKKSAGQTVPALLVSKGFQCVVQKRDEKVKPTAWKTEKLSKPILPAYVMTTSSLDRALIAELVARNKILIVTPDLRVLPDLLDAVRVHGVPFATLGDISSFLLGRSG